MFFMKLSYKLFSDIVGIFPLSPGTQSLFFKIDLKCFLSSLSVMDKSNIGGRHSEQSNFLSARHFSQISV